VKAPLRRLARPRGDAHAWSAHSTSRSHIGRVRQINEDRVLDRADLGLWAVADGMGGQSRGDAAAETVISALAALAGPIEPDRLTLTLEQANREVYRAGAGESGTTLVLLHVDRGVGTLRWAGDSRAYLIRNERLKLLTRDHSVVQELVEAGLVEADRAAHHPQANVITRALGIAPQPNLETLSVALQPGDRVLLCSDGLSHSMNERDVQGRKPLGPQADRLLTNALQRDGSDNTSLVLVEIT